MGFIHKIVEKRKFKKSQEYQDYLAVLNLNEMDTPRFLRYYKEATVKVQNLLDNGVPTDSRAFLDAKYEMQRWYYTYVENMKEKDFIRPNSKAEIDERLRIWETFADNLTNIVGQESDLRFHGTPIYFAKDIIETKTISSTADRFEGYIKSTDSPGEFSASDIKTLKTTINYFSDFASYRRCLPCGVIFVLKEKSGDEELRERSVMQNVNFDNNPEQLVGILCTSEVFNTITRWCNESGLDTSKVFTYDSFLSNVYDITNLNEKKM